MLQLFLNQGVPDYCDCELGSRRIAVAAFAVLFDMRLVTWTIDVPACSAPVTPVLRPTSYSKYIIS
jgi:hypothetical protein